jgi:hypothetical protein
MGARESRRRLEVPTGIGGLSTENCGRGETKGEVKCIVWHYGPGLESKTSYRFEPHASNTEGSVSR